MQVTLKIKLTIYRNYSLNQRNTIRHLHRSEVDNLLIRNSLQTNTLFMALVIVRIILYRNSSNYRGCVLTSFSQMVTTDYTTPSTVTILNKVDSVTAIS